MNGIKSFRIDGRGCLRAALGLLLLSPYLIWLAKISSWHSPELHTWWRPLGYALLQAFVSAALSCVVGFVLWAGLQSLKRGRGLGEVVLLLPNMIPPLFLILSLLSLVSLLLSGFPYGMTAVIGAHVLINSGLAATALDRLLRAKIGGMAETAWILGVKPWQFWRRVAWPQVRADICGLFLFIFSICFTSFSIPLLLSGRRAVTLEVAIYDAIRMEGAWDKAVMLAALQSAILLILALLLPVALWPERPARSSLDFLGWRWARVLVFVPAVLLALGWLIGLAAGLREGLSGEVLQALPEALLTTTVIALATGVLHLLLFLLTAFVLPHGGLNRFLNGYLAPSAAITGFGLLFIPIGGDILDLLKVVLALSLLSYPLLYRWLVHSALTPLSAQIAVARTLGAGWRQILFDVVWPQSAGAILKACGLAAVWAAGDFAISGILLSHDVSLPLLIQDQLGNYRFEQASLLMIALLGVSVFCYSLFVRSARYVVG